MDTSKSSLNIGTENYTKPATEGKSYQWLMKWISGQDSYNDSNTEETQEFQSPSKPDVSALAAFLQAIGFKLLSFEKHNDAQTKGKEEDEKPRPGVLAIAIECGTTDMRATLELDEVSCRCPNPEHVKDASFWSITGTGPTGSVENITQKVEETGSNLLPHLSKDVTKVLRDVSSKLFELIISEPDLNRNTERSFNIPRSANRSYEHELSRKTVNTDRVTRSHTQPEIRTQASNLSSKSQPKVQTNATNSEPSVSRNVSPERRDNFVLRRQATWDLDEDIGSLDGEPRPSPPKITSSPALLVELSNSLGQISLQSDNEYPTNLIEYIMGAQQNLERALKLLSAKNPTVPTASPNPDQDCVSVRSAPAKTSPTVVAGITKSTELDTTRNIQSSTRISYLPPRQSFSKGSSTESHMPTPRARRSMEPALMKLMPRKNSQTDQGNSNLRRRSFGASYVKDANSLLAPKPLSIDASQKILSNAACNTKKTNLAPNSNLPNRTSAATKKHVSPELQRSVAPLSRPGNLHTGAQRSFTPLKPSKISKAIPVKQKPMAQGLKINAEGVKRTRSTPSQE